MAANGAVMRTGVVGALFFQDKDSVGGIQRTMEAAISIGALTHADPR
jgi:ADP-ribosylglycohydrolase